jgi:hypothetical protein
MGPSDAILDAQHYLATVPDTLDLAERAALAVNALIGAAECEKGFCETIQTSHLDHRPPYMNLRYNGPCLQKPVHALPMMRVMSGSTQNADMDARMMAALTRDVDEHGLWWLKVANRPWRAASFKEDQVWPVAQGRLIVALLDLYRYDADTAWPRLAERLADGLARIALRGGDRAWYHTAYLRSGWRAHPNAVAGTQADIGTVGEPETSAFFDIGLPLRGFARWYAFSGDKQALDLADRLARYLMKAEMWGGVSPEKMVVGSASNWAGKWECSSPEMLVGAEHGHWQGHFHTHTMAMMGLLDYGLVRHDAAVLRFVQGFYEYARCFGIARMGFTPAVLRPVSTPNGPYAANEPQCAEGCNLADMLWLAATLSQAGVGDYWEDVDQIIRNHLVEHQYLRRDLLEAMANAGPRHQVDPSMETDERVIERNIGAFASGSDPTMLYGWWTACCLGNCPVGLYKAWESIVGCDGGVAQVNLFLNRASPWLDVASYLPYEGKVVLTNKTAHKIYVRIPLWADKSAVRCLVNEQPAATHRLGSYLAIEGLAPRDVVTIEFPMVETVETYTLPSYPDRYTLRFKGNTVVDISPRADHLAITEMGSDDGAFFKVNTGYPIYQREHYRRDRAPIVEKMQYVSGASI